jgi:hypothetical protein
MDNETSKARNEDETREWAVYGYLRVMGYCHDAAWYMCGEYFAGNGPSEYEGTTTRELARRVADLYPEERIVCGTPLEDLSR